VLLKGSLVMKLLYSKGACSLGVRIVINELGIPSEYESVDLKTKKTETGKDFLTINPKGSVPVLQIGDNEFLTENTAILQYLADKNEAHALLPPMYDFKHYRALEWLSFISSDLHKSFGALFNPKIPQNVKDELFIPMLKHKFKFVEKHLQHTQY
jgi:glutathione S-transferase